MIIRNAKIVHSGRSRFRITRRSAETSGEMEDRKLTGKARPKRNLGLWNTFKIRFGWRLLSVIARGIGRRTLLEI